MAKGKLNWLKASFEGVNRTASSRRLTTFWFVVLSTANAVSINVLSYLISLRLTVNNAIIVDVIDRLINLELILVGMVLLMASIITGQTILDGIRAVRGIQVSETKTITHEETDTTVVDSVPR